ncbi:ComF family protein [Epilithonimonas sp. UC225_85]|uniref:ComF family protein n=1 Tax=Epilithonimonas sp. UC225_85 TaxID=3350167 RepID=UPI0036D29A61
MLFDFLFPNRCLHCNQLIDKKHVVCEVCTDKIHFSNHQFHENNGLKEKVSLLFPVEKAFSLMMYEKESLSQKIIHQLKYNHREKIGKNLAEWTIEKVNFGEEKPDLLVTVPLHRKKLKQRGYNQLHLFGNELSRHYQIPIDHHLLTRTKHSKAQAKKGQSERLKTKNAYQLTRKINDKHILLIDDVYTTGNTSSNIAWEILRNSENVKVSLLVMAMDV